MIKNKKHITFIDVYMINGMNATDAYASVYPKAGPVTARKNGSKLLTNTDVKDEITRRQNITSTKLGITKEELIKDLIDIKDNTKSKSPIIAIKAIETLNKMNGFNDPEKSEITHKVEQPLFGDPKDEEDKD